ncbi:undecaprenyl/decaprenyl-phosphate alpha-N-acetylglucosaminyl 1-phosphate transferase [Streptomyces sp. NPDC003697]
MLYGIATAIVSLLLAASLAALLRVPALRLGLLDRRRARPVPLLGGVAVVVSTCAVAAAGDWTGVAPLGHGVARLLTAAAGVAVLGLVADVWRLKTSLLLVGSAVAAAFVVPYDETGVPAGILAVLWIACVAAAFRGLDHADGLAGTVGVLTAFGAGACAAAEVMDDVAVLLSVLAAALTGFLMHNWHPARTTFGACGTLFTGFVVASAAVLARTGYGLPSSASVLFPLTAVAAADALLVVVSRRLAGRPVLRRGPDHLAHRLRRLGLTPPGATVLTGVGTFAAVLVGVLVHVGWVSDRSALWVAGVSLAVVLGLLRVPAYGPRRQGDGTGAVRRPGDGPGAGGRRQGDPYATGRRATDGPGPAIRRQGDPYVMARRAADGHGSIRRPSDPYATGRRAADPYGTARRAADTTGAPGAFADGAAERREGDPYGARRPADMTPRPPQQTRSPQVETPLRVRNG